MIRSILGTPIKDVQSQHITKKGAVTGAFYCLK